ncbi:MAG: DUF188 domain-containing protein [Treponema sp.]|nr:DUF188 domain-containing protein [Candidatus Treponema equifaecale]
MYKFKIWIDADSFPQIAREYAVSLAKTTTIPITFVANHEIKTKIRWEGFKMEICPAVSGAADDFICQNVSDNDIVLTRDIPFAARLVEKKITVINDRGQKFTKDNIQDRLAERQFSLNLSEIGLGGGKSNYYSEKELKKMASELEREVQTHIMNEVYNIKKY